MAAENSGTERKRNQHQSLVRAAGMVGGAVLLLALKVILENTLKQLEEPLSLAQVRPGELLEAVLQPYEEVKQIIIQRIELMDL